MTVNELIEKIKNQPGDIDFSEVIETIHSAYSYTPAQFTNGTDNNAVINQPGTNEGSCKIFAFAMLNNLDEQQTLACFGQYYREDVLNHPGSDNHANIRNFMLHGWAGIEFNGEALHPKD